MKAFAGVVWSALVISAAPCLAAAPRVEYPTKFIRFIVPWAPGGSSDVLARTLGQKLGESLGQTLVVDNRPGAGSMVGTDVLARATPDGYTIILSDMPHTINPSIHAKVPYHPVEDFAPISIVGVSPMFLFAHPSFQAQNVKDLIALARSQPGKIAIASGGTGATTHLAAELFQSGAGIRLTHVPYKGAGPAITDVVAGQVPITFTTMATAAPFVSSKRLRMLGVTSPKRHPQYADVPTFQESGVPSLVFEHWWGVMAPAGTPKPVIGKLHGEIVKAVNTPQVRERFSALAVQPRTNTPEEFRALLLSDLERWAKIVKAAGIKSQ
jgi:tripartite-type tricarboxylate transporter receptor subunit TctC